MLNSAFVRMWHKLTKSNKIRIWISFATFKKIEEAVPTLWCASVENGEFCQDRVYLKLVQNVMFLTKVRGEFVKGKEWNFTFSTL